MGRWRRPRRAPPQIPLQRWERDIQDIRGDEEDNAENDEVFEADVLAEAFNFQHENWEEWDEYDSDDSDNSDFSEHSYFEEHKGDTEHYGSPGTLRTPTKTMARFLTGTKGLTAVTTMTMAIPILTGILTMKNTVLDFDVGKKGRYEFPCLPTLTGR
jgi:hypothetical protein